MVKPAVRSHSGRNPSQERALGSDSVYMYHHTNWKDNLPCLLQNFASDPEVTWLMQGRIPLLHASRYRGRAR
jgi:hypothetical protein